MSYLTATGQIRVLEKKLLDETDIERMVDAKNAEEAVKVFNDTDLADNLLDVKPEEFKKALDEDLEQTKKFLEKTIPDENLFRLLFLQYDFHNIKLLCKAKISEKDFSASLSDVGTIKKEDLKEFILENNKKIELHQDIAEILNRVSIFLEKRPDDKTGSPSPSEIDLTLDKEYFALILNLAKKIGNNFILDFVKWQIDITNVKMLLRVKSLEKDTEFLKTIMIRGGNIDCQILNQFLEKDIEELINFLRGYLTISQEKFLKEYAETKNLWQLEKGFENLEMDFVKKAKRIAYGPELVLAYYYAKKNAIRNVRLIMTGKLNGIAGEEIKARVREVY